ncbi:type II secretion system protein GspM [Comamonas sp. lk]|uniref:type II secretion system protein GspM n=1 Tax=Comamonas sp. lk TaxID=2201272 RepID=UPI000EB3AFC4|nr:type II secretion system protein GspM [Comamonas sp. lk]
MKRSVKTLHLSQTLAPLRQRWQGLAAREQNLLLLAGSLVLLALVWWLALAPALSSLRTAPARHAQADRELQLMLRLQAQAEQLRQQPAGVMGDAPALLQQSLTAELGTAAQLQWLGQRAQITLTGAPAPALARWLSKVRDDTRATTAEMKLSRAPASQNVDAAVRWNGSLLLDFPDSQGER